MDPHLPFEIYQKTEEYVNHMSTHFTVVIPTRQRCETLNACLQTCLAQDYDNCDFLISDNASTDETREIVSSFHDSRIRYVNTGERLGIASSWEFALSRDMKDGYVVFIGDDDGLLPNALELAAKMIADFKPRALTCEEVGYHWPTYMRKELQNHVIIPLTSGNVRVDSKQAIHNVVHFGKPYSILPMIYRSFIQTNVIKEIMTSQGSGPFFRSMAPDLYSGIAIGLYLREYWHSMTPLILNGTSGQSIGTSCFFPGSDRLKAQENDREEKSIKFHQKLIAVESIPLIVGESVLQALDHLPFAAGVNVDFHEMAVAAVKAVKGYPSEHYTRVTIAFIQMAKERGMEAEIRRVLRENPNLPTPNRSPVLGVNVINRTLLLNGSNFGVKTVADAARLSGYILRLMELGYLNPRGIAASTMSFLGRELRSYTSSLRNNLSATPRTNTS